MADQPSPARSEAADAARLADLEREVDAYRSTLRAVEARLAETKEAVRQARALAQRYAEVAGRNMAYEMRRPRELLDDNPRRFSWKARDTSGVRWPALFARDLRRALRGATNGNGKASR